jgi:YceI-like domain
VKNQIPGILPRHGYGHQARRRHWLQWIAGSIVALLALILIGTWAFVRLQPVPAELALPGGRLSAPAGPLDGRWETANGSAAGFRVRETVLGVGNDTVGRTGSVSGTAVMSGGELVTASFRVDLGALRVSGKPSAQVASSLQTNQHPYATVRLARPARLPAAFASGQTVTIGVAGQLTLNGAWHPVSFSLTARRDGRVLQAVGQIPVAFATWGIRPPAGSGFLGSLASHGEAEFLLILRQP